MLCIVVSLWGRNMLFRGKYRGEINLNILDDSPFKLATYNKDELSDREFQANEVQKHADHSANTDKTNLRKSCFYCRWECIQPPPLSTNTDKMATSPSSIVIFVLSVWQVDVRLSRRGVGGGANITFSRKFGLLFWFLFLGQVCLQCIMYKHLNSTLKF
jgi:hypothetical protein